MGLNIETLNSIKKTTPITTPVLNSKQLIKNLKAITEEGYAKGYSQDFVAQSLREAMGENPEVVKIMDLPQNLSAIKEQIVTPYWTSQTLTKNASTPETPNQTQNEPLAQPHLEYEISSGKLSYVNAGEVVWQRNAVSGNASGRVSTKNKGALPPGMYQVPQAPRVRSQAEQSGAFCDDKNQCWSQPLTAEFSTQRDLLLIHPDGNVKGTRGCIGLQESDTSQVKAALTKLAKQNKESTLNLWVRF